MQNVIDKLIKNIKNKNEHVHKLLDYKDEFKKLLLDADSLALKIKDKNEVITKYEKFHSELTIKLILCSCIDIKKIDNEIFNELLKYANFSDDKLNELHLIIDDYQETIYDTSESLLESEINKQNIMQNANIKKVLMKSNNEDIPDELYSEFLKYITTETIPSLIMENMARISVFQITKFKELIKKDSRLNQLFHEYKENKKLSKEDKLWLNYFIEEHIKLMLTEFPITYKNENGVSIAKLDENYKINNLWTSYSPAYRPDAWGIDKNNNKLYISCVTSNTNFDSQNNQSLEWAYRIKNGIKKQGIHVNDFAVHTWCKPFFNDDKKGLYKAFQTEIQHLSDNNIINYKDINTLKKIAIDCELMSIFKSVSIHKYDDLKDHLTFGIAGENISIKPKKQKEQYLESLGNIHSALVVMNKIIEHNKTLLKIDHIFGQISVNIATGLYNAINSPLRSKSGEPYIDDATSLLINLKSKLMIARNDAYKQINIAEEKQVLVNLTAETLNQMYNEEQEYINNNTMTSFKKNSIESTVVSGLNFQHSTTRSLILNLNNKLNISNQVLNDTLKFQILLTEKKLTAAFKYNKKNLSAISNCISKVFNSNISYDISPAIKYLNEYMLTDIMPKLSNEHQKKLRNIYYNTSGPQI